MNEENKLNNSSAFSFADGSFATNEQTDASPDLGRASNTSATENENAPSEAEMGSTPPAKDTTPFATSFGDGSFVTYEKTQPEGADGGAVSPFSNVKKETPGALGVTSWILFLAAFPLSFIGLIVMIVSVIAGGAIGAPVIGVMLVVPIASICLGIYLRVKYRIGLKNIIGGALCLAFMLLMLACSFGEINMNHYDDYDPYKENPAALSLMESAEALIGADLPENGYYYLEDSDESNVFCEVSYEHEEFLQLVEIAKSNPNFKTQMPSTYIGILPPHERYEDYDFCLVYNLTTGKFNEIPDTEGTYSMMCISVYSRYDGTSGYVTVTRYELDYTTSFKAENNGFNSDF